MTSAAYLAIKTEWCKISSAEQRNLIYRYIDGNGSNPRGSWMEFLQEQFDRTCKSTSLPCNK